MASDGREASNERHLVDGVMAERLQYQELAARIAARFVDVSADEAEEAVRQALQLIGEHFGTDVVIFARGTVDGELVLPTYAWFSKGHDVPGAQEYIDSRAGLNVFEHLLREGELVFADLDEHPEWPEEMAGLKHFGIKAAAVVRVRFDGEVVTLLSLNAIRSARRWPEDTVQRLRFVGQVLADAVSRTQAERELREALAENERLRSQLESENLLLRQEIQTIRPHGKIVGQSDAMRHLLAQVEQVAPTDSTVLITGETGTGKELVALAIHEQSRRCNGPFVKVNCAAIPATLMESELFGREKGAFTGALARQIGRFELADGGTIFLDEVSELAPETQGKLLRVLQENQFERLGDPRTRTADVRMIAATNRDLATAMAEGSFRQDLYYRLNVFPLHVVPLRERSEDIPLLVWSFVRDYAERMGKQVEVITRRDMEQLQRYSWPGNVRELKNVIERSMILATGSTLRINIEAAPRAGNAENGRTLDDVQREHILRVLEQTGWRIGGEGGAAEILGMKRTTLLSRMQKLGIEKH